MKINFDDNDLVRDELKELLHTVLEVDAIKDDIMFWTTADLSALVVIHGIIAGKMLRIKFLMEKFDSISQIKPEGGTL